MVIKAREERNLGKRSDELKQVNRGIKAKEYNN